MSLRSLELFLPQIYFLLIYIKIQRTQTKERKIIIFIHFSCLCPLDLDIKLNFNISKGADLTLSNGFNVSHVALIGIQGNCKL